MKTLAVITIGLVLSSAIAQEKAPKKTFDQQYMEQVDKTNAALASVAETECIAKELPDRLKKLETEYEVLKKMMKDVPDDEDVLLQAKETELWLGIKQVTIDVLEEKTQCIKDSTPKVDPNNGIS